jgi:hypothetical protein
MSRPDDGRKRTWRFRLNDTSILEVSTPPRATEKQIRRRGRVSLIVGTLLAAVALAAVALASDVDVAVVDATAPTGSVTLAPGASGNIAINLSVTGNQVGTATFKVNRDWTLSGNAFSGANPQTFTVPPRAGGDPATTFSTTGTVTVASGQANGTFTLEVGAFDITNSNATGAKLAAGDSSNYSVTVLAPPPPSDTTAPTINCTVPDQTVWYANEVSVSCTASDTSGLADPTNDAAFSLTTNVGAGNESASAQTNSNQVCDTVSPTPNCATAGPYTFMVDRKAPQLSSCDAPDGLWHSTNVTLQCHYSDGGSGPGTQDVDLMTSIAAGDETNDAAASANGVQACDNVNNCADSPADIGGNMIDRKAPTITCDSPAPTFVLNQSPAFVTGVAVDGGSGPGSQNLSAAADTSSVLNNPKSVDLNASDNVSNGATKSCSYSVIYDWNGFFSPVENPTAWNSAKAGQSVPVKFSLGGDQGLNIFASGYPKIFSIACPNGGVTPDPIEEYATITANSKLIYDALDNQYNYVWKTDKAWAGKCFRLDVKLNDNTTHSANFQFTK